MCRTIAQLICVLSLTCQLTQSNPLDLPWADPCGGASSVAVTEGQGGTSAGGTVFLRNIATSAAESVLLARTLRMKYNNASDPKIRISTGTAAFLAAAKLAPLTNDRPVISEEAAALQSDYDHVSTMAVFMENVHMNENTSANVTKYNHEMDDFETSLYHVLCKIKIAAVTRGHSLEVSITRDVMDSSFKNLANNAVRYQRDFIVFRDSEGYLETLSNAY